VHTQADSPCLLSQLSSLQAACASSTQQQRHWTTPTTMTPSTRHVSLGLHQDNPADPGLRLMMPGNCTHNADCLPPHSVLV
jgi:hypothetical protein